jgi:uncharacterized protein (DUF885 family)
VSGSAASSGVPILTKRLAASLFVMLLISACASEDERRASLAARVDSIADAFFDANLELNPELYTSFGLANADHSRIRDNSLAGVKAAEARFDAFRASADAIDPSSLEGTPQEVTVALNSGALRHT